MAFALAPPNAKGAPPRSTCRATEYDRAMPKLWVARLNISAAVTQKINSKHGVTVDEVRHVRHTREVDMKSGANMSSDDDESPDVVRAIMARQPDVVTGRYLSVLDVAAAILARLGGRSDAWKLQKLCYLVQARHLARTGLPAFGQHVEAWTHGPVVRDLYREHRGRRMVTAIPGNAAAAEADPTLVNVIDAVIKIYGSWSGMQLRDLTHNQRPWQDARGNLPPTAPSSNVIAPGAMRDYFTWLDALPKDDAEDDLAGISTN